MLLKLVMHSAENTTIIWLENYYAERLKWAEQFQAGNPL